ncbi:prolyl 4-hydroxylase subunit alpha-2 [Trichonephila clavipes]|nr:prolyl 4-hydroxylase subunit alpha-2 [Trichonephila clavipes]
MEDHALIFATGQLIHQYFRTGVVVFEERPRRTLFARDLVTWHANGVCHILGDIVKKCRVKERSEFMLLASSLLQLGFMSVTKSENPISGLIEKVVPKNAFVGQTSIIDEATYRKLCQSSMQAVSASLQFMRGFGSGLRVADIHTGILITTPSSALGNK